MAQSGGRAGGGKGSRLAPEGQGQPFACTDGAVGRSCVSGTKSEAL